jgi:predicted transcriptional regulator
MITNQSAGVASLPDDLDSPQAKLVYLFLTTAGSATVDELSDELDLKCITLFSVLGTLEDRQLVARDGDEFTPAR